MGHLQRQPLVTSLSVEDYKTKLQKAGHYFYHIKKGKPDPVFLIHLWLCCVRIFSIQHLQSSWCQQSILRHPSTPRPTNTSRDEHSCPKCSARTTPNQRHQPHPRTLS